VVNLERVVPVTQETTKQAVQKGRKGCCKEMMKNCPMMSEKKMDKASIAKKMSNCPMMKNKNPEQRQQMMKNCPMMKKNDNNPKCNMNTGN